MTIGTISALNGEIPALFTDFCGISCAFYPMKSKERCSPKAEVADSNSAGRANFTFADQEAAR